jgi:acyl carrier protein
MKMSSQSRKQEVVSTLHGIAARKHPHLPPLALDQELGSVGLSSLDLAELVATLEIKLDLNPFATGAVLSSLKTVGDIVSVYADA